MSRLFRIHNMTIQCTIDKLMGQLALIGLLCTPVWLFCIETTLKWVTPLDLMTFSVKLFIYCYQETPLTKILFMFTNFSLEFSLTISRPPQSETLIMSNISQIMNEYILMNVYILVNEYIG